MYRPAIPIASNGQPVTALAFDPVSDTIWAGDNSGVVCALHSVHGIRGVSFPVGGALPVKQLAVADNHVRALGLAGHGVGAWAKGGMNKWYFRCVPSTHPAPSNTAPVPPSPPCPPPPSPQACSPLPPPHPTSFSSTRSPAPPSARHRSSRMSPILPSPTPPCSAHPPMDTYARTTPAPHCAERTATAPSSHMPVPSRISRQPATFSSPSVPAQGPFPPLPLPLSLTSPRRGHDFPDPLVKVYDLRNMRPLPPIPFSDGPAFINLLPMQTSSLVVTSVQGLVNVVDVSNTNTSGFYHVCLPLLSSHSSNPSSARHHILHHINCRFIKRLLLGLWRCSRYNPSPHSSR